MSLLVIRPRQLYGSPGLRKIVSETNLLAGDFIYTLFVVHGNKGCRHVRQAEADLIISYQAKNAARWLCEH